MRARCFAGPNGFVPVNRFSSYPGWDSYQTESGAITSLFEHSFSENLTVRQNTRYVHMDGIYRQRLSGLLFQSRQSVRRCRPPQRLSLCVWHATSKDFLTSDSNAELKFATGPVTHKMLFGVDYRDFKQQQFDQPTDTTRRRSICTRRSTIPSLRRYSRRTRPCVSACSGSTRRTKCGSDNGCCRRRSSRHVSRPNCRARRTPRSKPRPAASD